jgi:hypothetical protein
MQKDKALEILNALSDGLDPGTGERFPDGSPYQHPDTVRALCFAVQVLQTLRTSNQRAAPRSESAHANAGRPWTESEEAQLASAFDAGVITEELVQRHKRSRWAIEARLVRLGMIAEPLSPSRFPVKKSTASERPAVYS